MPLLSKPIRAGAARRAQNGRDNYAMSQLKVRNEALQRAASLGAVQADAKGVGLERLQGSERLLNVRDYCQMGPLSVAQVNKDREPHLLIPDPYNPGEFTTEPIYDSRVEWSEDRTGLCWIDIHRGELLVSSGTAVYWR